MKFSLYFFASFISTIGSCNTDADTTNSITEMEVDINTDEMEMVDAINDDEEKITTADTDSAKIVSVDISGTAATNYTFSVGISSPDTGCDQYADWWEVITEEGELIYRRILTHSHVTEQPFVRSGSGIITSEEQVLIIRAHMNTLGYGTQVFKGTVSSGFSETTTIGTLASDLATQEPLPDGCDF